MSKSGKLNTNININDLNRTFCAQGSLNFSRYFFLEINNTKFIIGKQHEAICNELDKVVRGETTKLIINIAPRYGKTELAVKMFISYGFAINPQSRFIHLSYSSSLTQDNSVAIKDIVKSEAFKQLFKCEVRFGSDTKSRWDTLQGGGLYATSTLGQITGFGAGATDKEEEINKNEELAFDEYAAVGNPNKFNGAIVIDDPLKPEDALSDVIRERVNRRFETTIRNRVNSRKTPIVIIMQRLHEHDLCGYLQEIEPDEWKVLSLPCLTVDEYGNEHSLWEFKHTVEELHKIEHANSFVFETQYQQNPTPLEGLMYTKFNTYDTLPITHKKPKRKNYTDTADTGADFLCSICYLEYDFGIYITDILYTNKAMEYTEAATTRMLIQNETEEVNIESNNGGRGFARNVEKNVRELGNTKMRINTFTQTLNKNVRIFTHSNDVQNMIYYPSDWEKRWYDFANSVKSYRKEGRNIHDDAEDVLTGIIEKIGGVNPIPEDVIFNSFS